MNFLEEINAAILSYICENFQTSCSSTHGKIGPIPKSVSRTISVSQNWSPRTSSTRQSVFANNGPTKSALHVDHSGMHAGEDQLWQSVLVPTHQFRHRAKFSVTVPNYACMSPSISACMLSSEGSSRQIDRYRKDIITLKRTTRVFLSLV